ncbi:MAG TPA: nuclear transport factor 2 family protein [Dinghuibacter sp.]|uniref:nuclear transport factor 2 family protein n=1 Tax=Dinghuibacter sp. TaxID=2024697 RepID=UPI002C7926C0|nr:nuclear transport factor 2 family protein [Dinghuibacter sp.]HTJ13289.1 nuclear transport factor 2 family protein [Dinghuibacter sp.]
MTTQQIADRLVALCKEGKWEQAHKELYAADCVSIEPEASPGFEKEVKGMAAIDKKGKDFDAMVEATHGITTSQPLVTGNTIAFVLDMDMTMKGRPRSKMAELCVYTVKDGKIAAEQFFM